MSIHSDAAEAAPAALLEDTGTESHVDVPLHDRITTTAARLAGIGISVAGNENLLKTIATGGDAIVAGEERAFTTAAVAVPALSGVGLIAVIVPTMDALRRCRRVLEGLNIRVVSFDLAPTKADKRAIWETLDRDMADVVLISPGRLASARFRDRITRRSFGLVTVLQAHQMSPWSHRFVPSFRQIGCFLSSFQGVPKVAHIWTTEGRVHHDIQKILGLKTPQATKLSHDPQLLPRLEGRLVKHDDERISAMAEFMAHHECQGVIYAGSVKQLHDVKRWLETMGETPSIIRPGMDEFSIQKIRTAFENGETRLVISQGAFLSTLEKAPGLEFAIFNGMPDSIEFLGQELFAQETASPIACLTLSSEHDYFHHRFAIDKSYPDALVLRSCFQGVRDTFGGHSMVSPDALRTHVKIATPYSEEDITQCIQVMQREGLIEHVVDSTRDKLMVKMTNPDDSDANFWHEYPLRKLDQISRLEKTRDFVTTSGELGKQLRTLLRI